MWRVRFSDGRLSDRVNLARAKDAAELAAARSLPELDSRSLQWEHHPHESAAAAPSVAQIESAAIALAADASDEWTDWPPHDPQCVPEMGRADAEAQ